MPSGCWSGRASHEAAAVRAWAARLASVDVGVRVDRGAVVQALLPEGVAVIVLAVDSEEMVGEVLVRWVRVPEHLDESCRCGDVDLMVLAGCPGLWIPGGTVGLQEERADVIDDLRGEGLAADAWDLGAEKLCAAFGLPWEDLSLAAVRGLLVLLRALEEETLELLQELETLGLLEMRRACGKPAQVLRALWLLRDHMGRAVEGPPR